MMDKGYAQDGYAQGGSAVQSPLAGRNTLAPRTPKPMDRIGDAAERIEATISQMEGIVGRFQGFPPTLPECAGDNAAVLRVSYVNQIDRLHALLDRLGKTVDVLDSIG